MNRVVAKEGSGQWSIFKRREVHLWEGEVPAAPKAAAAVQAIGFEFSCGTVDHAWANVKLEFLAGAFCKSWSNLQIAVAPLMERRSIFQRCAPGFLFRQEVGTCVRVSMPAISFLRLSRPVRGPAAGWLRL